MSRYLSHLLPKLKMSALDDCPVCHKCIESPAIIPCGHIVCISCGDMLENCPICRTKLPEQRIVVNIEKVMQLNDRYFDVNESRTRILEGILTLLKQRTYPTKAVLLNELHTNYFPHLHPLDLDILSWHYTFVCQLRELLWDGIMPQHTNRTIGTQTID